MPLRSLIAKWVWSFVCLAILKTACSGETPKPSTLLVAATEQFSTRKLTRAEIDLFNAVAKGDETNEVSLNPMDNDISKSDHWADRDQRIIDAECLKWLCQNGSASSQVTPQGININGCIISGSLNLNECTLNFPLTFTNCAFSSEIYIRFAKIRSLTIADSHLNGLAAEGTTFDGVCILGSCESGKPIRLGGAEIGKYLTCSGSHFYSSDDGIALDLGSASIKDSVLLGTVFYPHSKSFRAFTTNGQVQLAGVVIGQDLSCDGAQLSSDYKPALAAEGAQINGFVFLRGVAFDGQMHPFTASGVDLAFAHIGRGMKCANAEFDPPDFIGQGGLVLDALAITIDGSLEFGEDPPSGPKVNSTADQEGVVSLNGAARFDSALVGRIFSWHNVDGKRWGSLSLRSAKVGVLDDQLETWPNHLDLRGFSYDYLQGPLTIDQRLSWLELQNSGNFSPQPYDQLASVLRRMGYEQDATKIEYGKNLEYAKHTRWISGDWWWYNVVGWIIGYGYEPGWVFCMSLFFIALGAVLFHFGYANKLIVPTKTHGLSSFNSLIYSFESFIPLIKLDQSENWAPYSKFGWGGALRCYLWLHIILGWVLTTLWIGGLTGLVKT